MVFSIGIWIRVHVDVIAKLINRTITRVDRGNSQIVEQFVPTKAHRFGPKPKIELDVGDSAAYKSEAPGVDESGRKRRFRRRKQRMSGAANPSTQDEDKKPNDQSGHINLKVKGQVLSFDFESIRVSLCFPLLLCYRLGFLSFFSQP